ncbi:MAG: hypothetical protein HY718_17185 [Planctomycetes bacterium]|nr:hypothetical protein [Planctomycetota bacterium]
MISRLVLVAESIVSLSCIATHAQVQLMGKVWMPRAPELAAKAPANTGLAEDYFAPGRPADPPELLPLAGIRCFGSLDDSDSQALSHATWETAPAGWYRLSGSAGRYTLLFTGPSKFIRPVIVTNVYAVGKDVIDRKVVPPAFYAVCQQDRWDDKAAAAYYQTFIAGGTSVTNVGFKAVHDGVDGGGPGNQTILVSIHQKGPGTPDTWPQVGPTVPVPGVDCGGPKNYEWSAAWNSGEVPTVPGETYAVCLKPATPGNGFQMFWRLDGDRREDCYRVGKDAQAGFVGRDLWIYVAGDGDGLLIPYNKHIHKQYGEFAGFSRRWSQTYLAQGRGLAAVVLYAATGGSQPAIQRQRLRLRVRKAGPDGPVVGVEKIAVGEGIHTGDASWGTFGAVFAPGEVALEPGRTYALDFESIENYASLHGYVNIKGVPSDEKAGFNPYRRQPGESCEHGTAYKDGQDAGFDLDMQIVEYEHAVENWARAVDPDNLLLDGDMQSGDLAKDDTDTGSLAGWTRFTTGAATAHRYVVDVPGQDNRILRVQGEATPGKPIDGGYVQRVAGLSHLDTWRITGRVRCSWPLDADHACYVGIDPTGQDADSKADSIRWAPLPSIHSIFVAFDGGPVRTKTGAISVWLRAAARSTAGFPFRADFDDFALRRVHTGIPGVHPVRIAAD